MRDLELKRNIYSLFFFKYLQVFDFVEMKELQLKNADMHLSRFLRIFKSSGLLELFK